MSETKQIFGKTIDMEKIRQKRAETLKQQANDPIRLYYEKYQKKHRTHPRIREEDNRGDGGKGFVMYFIANDGERYYEFGENLTEARRNLCKTLLQQNIDI